MIETKELSRRFGSSTAVDRLTISIGESEIFGFLGPNGAGKTTTIRMLACLIAKSSGAATIDGLDIGDPAARPTIRRMVGIVPDNVGLYDDLSAYRNLDFFGRMYDCPERLRSERIERFLRMLDLWDKRDVRVGAYSKGMKQKIAIVRALVHDPKVLFLDEPTANLDPEASRTVREFIRALRDDKKAIVLNTHNLDEAQRLCDRIGILRTSLLTVGTPTELEGRLRGREIVLDLVAVSAAIEQAVRGAARGAVSRDGNRFVIAISDDSESASIVEAVVLAGGKVVSLSERRATLEDVYFDAVGRSK